MKQEKNPLGLELDRSILTVDLEEALEGKGCAFCRLLDRAERRAMWYFLFEGVMDPFSRDRVLNAWGFCAHHTRVMAEVEAEGWSDAHLGSGVYYEALIERLRRMLAHAGQETNSHTVQSTLQEGLMPSQPCPACQTRNKSIIVFSSRLAVELSREGFRERLRQSDGLCLPHLADVFQQITREDSPGFLLDAERKRREKLSAAIRSNLAQRNVDWVLWADVVRALELTIAIAERQSPEDEEPVHPVDCGWCEQDRAREEIFWTRVLEQNNENGVSWQKFCSAHLWDWAGRLASKDPETLSQFALMAADELDAQCRQFNDPRDLASHDSNICGVCQQLDDPYEWNAKPLCLPHLRRAYAAVPSESVAAVTAREIEYLDDLLFDLQEMMRKHEARFAHEPKGKEQWAWLRAGEFAAGYAAMEGLHQQSAPQFDNWLNYSLSHWR